MNDKLQFVKNTYDVAYQRLIELGKDDKSADFYARMVAAQGSLESDFGKKESGSFNYFGLKASPQQDGEIVVTHEFSGNNRKKTKDKFLNFDSFETGIRSAVDRLGTKFHAFKGELTPESYVDTIWNHNYFTEPRDEYLKRIKGVLNGSVLPVALKDSEVNISPKSGMPQAPLPPIPQLVHPNDATRVVRPTVFPLKRKDGGVLYGWSNNMMGVFPPIAPYSTVMNPQWKWGNNLRYPFPSKGSVSETDTQLFALGVPITPAQYLTLLKQRKLQNVWRYPTE